MAGYMPGLYKKINNKTGAAGYIELMFVFVAIMVILAVFLTIVRVAVVRMAVMDITRSELRTIEILGRVNQSNVARIKERLDKLGLNGTVSIKITETEYGDIVPVESDITSLSDEIKFNYRNTIKLDVSVSTSINIPGFDLEVSPVAVRYNASYTGTSQRYFKP